MSSESSQEKTEQATPKRRQDAREKGQTPKSRDLNTAIIMFMGSSCLLFFGQPILSHLSDQLQQLFTFNLQQFKTNEGLINLLTQTLYQTVLTVLPILLALFFAALIGPLLLNGGTFQFNSIQFKLDKLNFFKGVKRIFSLKSVVELIKALLKFLIVGFFSCLLLWTQIPKLLALTNTTFESSVAMGISLLAWCFFGLSATLLIIAAIDVPYQLWEFTRELKMTKQEVRDEFRNSEGKPEVKSHIRQVQQELTRKRMMDAIPTADVVITNPTHFAVALKYDEKSAAPRVVAKGQDFIALQIRHLAQKHQIELISAPPLARSIYHTTSLNQEVPRGLYVAVAQILAYVYQLKRYRKGGVEKPKLPASFDIPEDLRY